MYFKLINGVARFALAKATVTAERPAFNEDGSRGKEIVEATEYLYTEEELLEYPDHDSIDQPTPEILDRAEKIKGTVLSKTEFEKLLFNKTKEEIMQETIDALVLDALERGASDV